VELTDDLQNVRRLGNFFLSKLFSAPFLGKRKSIKSYFFLDVLSRGIAISILSHPFQGFKTLKRVVINKYIIHKKKSKVVTAL